MEPPLETAYADLPKILNEIDGLLDPKTFIGRAPEQVKKFTGKPSPCPRVLMAAVADTVSITGAGGEVVRALVKYEGKVQIAEVADLHV